MDSARSPYPPNPPSNILSMFGIKSQHKMELSPRANPLPIAVPGPNGSAFMAPEAQKVVDLNTRSDDAPATAKAEDEDKDEIEYTPTKNGRRLRERKPNTSLKALENGDLQVQSENKRKYKKRSRKSDLIGGDIDQPTPVGRGAIRQEIATITFAKRNQFLVENKDLWLPLLPLNNHVSKLVEQQQHLSSEEVTKLPTVTAYEELESQPRGIKAIMKPYQLSGLSFLIYLHRNGLSGILGDEMGLGKTLQTLSLCQYLKENDPKAGTGRLQRPCLVVCPLSVLSSWMQEAKKWAPGLKVVRFHGPRKERDRLKNIVMGEIDMFGNLTSQAKSKLNSRLNTAGKEVISLDTDSEVEDDLGVDLVVTTYESYKAEQGWFKRAFVWRYVILDEGHTVKNHTSLISKSVQGLHAEYRLILTGTPLQNDLSELWSLLHWLYPEVFSDKTNELFDNSFNLSKGKFSNTVLDDARRLLELIMLRRMKNSAGVDLNLPPKTEVLIFVPLSPMQLFWYKRMITKADSGLLDELFKGVKSKEEEALKSVKQDEENEAAMMKAMESEALEAFGNVSIGMEHSAENAAWKESQAILQQTVLRENSSLGDGKKRSQWQSLMNLVMRLRQVSNHPYQIQNAEPDPYITGEHVITASGKFIVLGKLINQLVVKDKKKVLVFSGFTQMLNLVEELMYLRGGDDSSFTFARIDGSTCRARRNLSIRQFNNLDSDCRVMLISTRAGGLGINLATASDVVLLDQDWNPQITLQAESRAHRIGQKNPVIIYKLVSQGTVEEQMMGRIQKKLYLSAKVFEAMEDIHTKFGSAKKAAAEDDLPDMSVNQLMTLIRRGASAISRPAVDIHEMLDWDWNTTVAKCKDQPADISVKKDAVPDTMIDAEAEKKWLSEMEKVEASIFEGKALAKSKSNKEIAEEFFAGEKADRRIGKNVTVMVDGFAVSKNTLDCAPWEAVKTISGTDPRLAERKREKKAAVEPQSHCQVCFDGGDLHCCQLCPRAFHYDCLDRDFKSKTKAWQFNCPQHECIGCEQKTTEAGGMLYRCRWCERAYCEDCLDFDKTKLLGNSIPEYEVLRFPQAAQAFYIQCPACTENFAEAPQNKVICDRMAEEWQQEHYRMYGGGMAMDTESSSTPADSMTDAATIETPGAITPGLNTPAAVFTPIVIEDEDDGEVQFTQPKKRTIKIQFNTSAKRARLEV